MGINFPSSPTVGDQYPTPPVIGVPTYSWDGEKWVTAISPSSGGAPFDAMSYSGMQINGSMEVSQELGTSGIANLSNTSKYFLDGWLCETSGPQVVSALQQVTAGFVPYGYTACAQVMGATAANPSPTGTNFCILSQFIEGYRISRLGWGTTSAKPITIGFWIYALRPGTYSCAIRNSALTRSYVFPVVVTTSATFQWVTATIPGETTGVWTKNNTAGILFSIVMMTGPTLQTAANTWAAGNFLGVTGMVNGMASTTDYMIVTGVVVLPGTQAPTAAQSPLIMRPYDQELVTCQRYL